MRMARQYEGPDRDLPGEAAELIDAARVLHARTLQLITMLAAGDGDGTVILELADAGARLGENAAGLRDLAGALTDNAACQFALSAAHEAGLAEGIGIGQARARVPIPRGGRHASPTWRAQPLMRLVPKVIFPAAAGTWAALKALGRPSLRHAAGHHAFTALKAAWASHPVGVVAGGTAATGTAAALLTAAVVIVAPPAHSPGPYASPSMSPPAASIYAAAPIPAPVAADPDPAAHGKTDAHRAAAIVVPPPVWYAPPSVPPSPSAAPTPSPTAGTLSLSTTSADLSTAQQATIELDASGAPVQWGAWCDDKADVLLSAGSGTAVPGVPTYLTLSALPGQDGEAQTWCHVWPGSYRVLVTLPLPPSPSPSPSPPATDLTPSPSPT